MLLYLLPIKRLIVFECTTQGYLETIIFIIATWFTNKCKVIVVGCFFNCIFNPVYDIWFTCSQRRLNNLMKVIQ